MATPYSTVSSLELVTVEEVAEMLGKTPASVRWMKHAGQLPRGAKISGRVMWKREQIIDWVNAQFDQGPKHA